MTKNNIQKKLWNNQIQRKHFGLVKKKMKKKMKVKKMIKKEMIKKKLIQFILRKAIISQI